MSKRRNTLEITEKRFESIREIDVAIKKFRLRIEDVKALDPSKVRYDSQNRRPVEDAIATTIREVYGLDSPEAHRHPYYEIRRGGLNMGDDEYERQQKFAAGIPEAVTFLEGFIKQFEEKKLYFEPPSAQEEAPDVQRSPTKIEQHVHGQVVNVAGRDITAYNITAVNLLSLIEEAVNKSEAIPAAEKSGLLQWLRKLKENPYVIGISSGIVAELFSKLLNR